MHKYKIGQIIVIHKNAILGFTSGKDSNMDYLINCDISDTKDLNLLIINIKFSSFLRNYYYLLYDAVNDRTFCIRPHFINEHFERVIPNYSKIWRNLNEQGAKEA